MRAKSIKNTARVNAELSPAELKGLLKKAQSSNSAYQQYIAALEAELAIWRSGGKVDPANYATNDKAGVVTATPAAKKPPPSRSMTPAIPAIESLRDLESRPQTPTVLGLDKDERDEFLKRENELTDQLGVKVGWSMRVCRVLKAYTFPHRNPNLQLKSRSWSNFGKSLPSSRSRSRHYRRSGLHVDIIFYCSVSDLPICLQENTTMSTQLNDLRLQLQRLDYEAKEGKITVDILKDQNQDLSRELEELQKSLNELKVSSKDSAATEDKERKKAEKMALMMAKFDVV